MSIRIGRPSEYQFLEEIKHGDLSEAFKKYSLKEKFYLEALETFIFTNQEQEMSPEWLSKIQQAVKQAYPKERAITGRVNIVAELRFLNSVEDPSTPEARKDHFEQKIVRAQDYIKINPKLFFKEWEHLFTETEAQENLPQIALFIDQWMQQLENKRSIEDIEDLILEAKEGYKFLRLDIVCTLLQSAPEFVSLEQIKEIATDFNGYVLQERLITPANTEVIFKKLMSEEDKKWFAQLVRENNYNPDKSILLNQWMAADQGFVLKYFPDWMLDFHSEKMKRLMSVDQRMAFAQNCLEMDPRTLVLEWDYLFTFKEKNDHWPEILDLMNKLKAKLAVELIEAVKANDDYEVKLKQESICQLESLRQKDSKRIERWTKISGVKYPPKFDPSLVSDSYLEKHNLYLQYLNTQSLNSDKNGHHWDCVGVDPQNSGCYVFRLKREYEPGSISEKGENFMIFPAVEPLEFTNLNKLTSSPAYALLGFQFEIGPGGAYLTVPDATTLETKWETLRKLPAYKDLGLPTFSCGKNEGTATPEEFIALLNAHDVVISKNTEFLHDIMVHGFETIVAILDDPKGYVESQRNMRTVRAKVQQILVVYQHGESKINRAAATLINEFFAISYDFFTACFQCGDRNKLINDWITGNIFTRIGGDSRWLMVLWQNPVMRTHLQALGVQSEYGEIPWTILQEKWAAFQKLSIDKAR